MASVPEFVNRILSIEPEPGTEQLGQPVIRFTDRTHRPAPADRLDEGLGDLRWIVTEQAGGVVTEEIDVAVTVDVGHGRTLGRRNPERERIDVQHRPGRSSGKNRCRGLGVLPTDRAFRRVAMMGVGPGRLGRRPIDLRMDDLSR